MPFINIPNIIANVQNFLPLKKTWYEEEIDATETKTLRFAKRLDGTGVLIQINKAEFFEENP